MIVQRLMASQTETSRVICWKTESEMKLEKLLVALKRKEDWFQLSCIESFQLMHLRSEKNASDIGMNDKTKMPEFVLKRKEKIENIPWSHRKSVNNRKSV